MNKRAEKKTGKDEASGPSNAGNEKEPRQPGTSTLEWIVAGISFLGLAAVLCYLLISAFTEDNGPARIEVHATGVTAMGDHFVVEFSAANLQGKSLAAVEIRGELMDGQEVVEETSVTLDYLPRSSERTAALIFSEDPARYELQLSAGGYVTP